MHATSSTERRRWLAAAAVLVAHWLLLWGLQQSLQWRPPEAHDPADAHKPRRLEVRLLPLPAASPAPTPTPTPTPPLASARSRSSGSTGATVPRANLTAPASARMPYSVETPLPTSTPTADPNAQAQAAAEPAPSPASAVPADTVRLLDNVATRRAIRESARESALGRGSAAQQAVEQSAGLRSATAQARLPGAIERSGKGDCAKGEFAGGGMGLLSLPFLAAAAINGDCAK